MQAVIMRGKVGNEQQLVGVISQSALQDTFGVVDAPPAQIDVVQFAVARDKRLVTIEQFEIDLLRLVELVVRHQAPGEWDENIGLKRLDGRGGAEFRDRG